MGEADLRGGAVAVVAQARGAAPTKLRQAVWSSQPTQAVADLRVNLLVKEHLGAKYSAHSLRASFITNAKLNGQSNEFIKNQTKQKTDAMISRYSRLDDIIAYNAAHSLDL